MSGKLTTQEVINDLKDKADKAKTPLKKKLIEDKICNTSVKS
jgi:hypothetical protein